MRFTNKVCLVTSVGSGIGRATAQRFAFEGGKLESVSSLFLLRFKFKIKNLNISIS